MVCRCNYCHHEEVVFSFKKHGLYITPNVSGFAIQQTSYACNKRLVPFTQNILV